METEWLPFSGHDSEGDQFDELVFAGVDGRILAVIQKPICGDYGYRLTFYCRYAYGCEGGDRFIDLEPAKTYAEETVKKALEKSRRKKPRGPRKKKFSPDPDKFIEVQSGN